MSEAFGPPGISATWTSSAKDMVTTALAGTSRVWLTLGHGIGNEIYWPSTGQPQVRDVGFVVVSGSDWVEVKRPARYTISTPEAGVLAPTVVHHGGGWDLHLEWIIDPDRDVVLIDYRLDGRADELVMLLAPHLGAGEHTNSGWVDDDLHAAADGAAAALCATSDRGFGRTSVGYVGASDGWQDLDQHGRMTWDFDTAPKGNIALAAQLPLESGTVAIGFAAGSSGATILARSSLADGVANIRSRFLAGWRSFAKRVDGVKIDEAWRSATEHSAAVIACHEDRTYPGATVASLSIPWGNNRSDRGGYHLVWARDCVEVAFARVALGDHEAARRTLSWLGAAQQPDGHWTQNAYPDGRPFWTGVQLDEVALPVLLAAALGARPDEPAITTMVQRAVRYLVANGPTSPQDRWEEDAGANAFTLATVVAALIAASPWLDPTDAAYALSLAGYWNDRIEDWVYITDGELCEGRDIAGYYVRMGRTDDTPGEHGRVDLRNRPDVSVETASLIACDFLALVRFGLRSPTDPRVVDTVSLIDELLAVDLPTGVAYRRYNGDGYGEHVDGSPFDGTGVGRPWPLLAGERGHYAAQAGEDPSRYLASMVAMSGPGNLLPEQVWDAAAIPERDLYPGRPTGSAMPLAWAHAELIKLATHGRRGRPVEQLPAVTAHLAANPAAAAWHWRVDLPFAAVPAGKDVVIDHPTPFTLGIGDRVLTGAPIGAGRHGATLAAAELPTSFELRTSENASAVLGRVDVGDFRGRSDGP